MWWLYRLQQRISIARNEALALIVLGALFALGLSVRAYQKHLRIIPPNAYDETDRLFFERSAARRSADSSAVSTRPTPPASVKREGASQPSVVDLNSATAADLESLPRIGPKTAQRILEFRASRSGFRTVDELTQVKGIGSKTLETIRPLVTVGAAPPRQTDSPTTSSPEQ